MAMKYISDYQGWMNESKTEEYEFEDYVKNHDPIDSSLRKYAETLLKKLPKEIGDYYQLDTKKLSKPISADDLIEMGLYNAQHNLFMDGKMVHRNPQPKKYDVASLDWSTHFGLTIVLRGTTDQSDNFVLKAFAANDEKNIEKSSDFVLEVWKKIN